jgi:hypothetical protein
LSASRPFNGTGQFREVHGAKRRPREDDAEDEAEVAHAVGEEGFLRGVSGGVFLEPEADEQVAAHAYQFPKHEHHEEVVREHDAEHREGEEAQAGEVTAEAAVAVQVAARVDVNHQPDAGDDEEHELGKRVEQEAEGDFQVADGEPVEVGFLRLVAREGEQAEAQDEAECNCADGKLRAEFLVLLPEQGDAGRRQQGQQQDQQRGHSGNAQSGFHVRVSARSGLRRARTGACGRARR